MDKREIARIFEEIALLLEFQGANPFRVRAYKKGARTLLNYDGNLLDLIEQKKLTDLEGIGEDLADKITYLVKKGRLPFYERLKKSFPKQLLSLRKVRGLGAKKIQVLYTKLKIQSLGALKKACLKGQLAKLPGFGKKIEKNILISLSHLEKYQERHLWWDAQMTAEPILEALRKHNSVEKANIAGSTRRGLETVGDIDFVAASDKPAVVAKWFVQAPFVEAILDEGEARMSVRLKNGMQADLRIVEKKDYPFDLCYFTGSQPHTVKLRERAREKGWSLSEYGFKTIGPKRSLIPKITSEEGLYKALSLPYIPPELREDCGEFDVRSFPDLVEESEIRGTFHNHTTASDGRSNLREMVEAAEALGWEYLGISDHSRSSVQANGLNIERLEKQIEEIDKLNRSKKYKIHLFTGTECDILPNGDLDYPDSLLKKLNYTIVSVHSSYTQDEKTMTRRIIRALEHPLTTMLGHPTGRLLLKREPYRVNLPKIIDAAIANKKMIEINGNPQRMDMDWRLWRKAAEKGLIACINTDAHSTLDHAYLRSGINVARKGWLTKKSIFNTRSLKQVAKFLQLHVRSNCC